MIAVDTNVLVYSHVESFPRHAQARDVLVRLAEGTKPWGIPAPCVVEFMRVVTHPRVLVDPYSVQEAVAALGALLASPSCSVLCPGEQHWPFLSRAMLSADARGNLAFDAAIAAVCEETGVTHIISEDRDFARFDKPTRVRLEDA